jgi:Xaa-Pro dipeptidase
MQVRLEKLSSWLKQESIDAAFLTSTANVFYLSGFLCHPHERLLGLFVFPEAEPLLICPQMEVKQAKNAGWSYEILGYDDTQNPWEMIRDALTSRKIQPNGVRTLAVEKDHLSYRRAELLMSILPGVRFISAEDQMHQLRMIKDSKEIGIMREAARLADYGVEVGFSALKEGVTEMEVVAVIEKELKQKGIQSMAFSTMVLFGEKSGLPHGIPGNRRLQEGDLVLFDLGVVLEGYCSDITRTVAYRSAGEQQREIYETVLQAQLSALDACKPGTPIGELDKTARNVIEKAGYGKYFPHRVGHGLGIEVHEYPSLTSTNTQPLQPGMTFTVEPGIYVEGVGGVRIEDDVMITEKGCEILTNFSKELLIIR